MLALSFMAGIFLAMRLAKKRGLNHEVIIDLAMFVIISAIIGARLYYVMTHYDEFQGNPLKIINPFQDGRLGISGLVMYGGFIAAIVTAVVFFRVKKLPTLQYLDVCSPSVGVGIALTRVGCFLNGCCYGAAVKAGSFLSINYPAGSPAGHYQRITGADGLFPSQFFESAGGLAIAAILILVGKSKFNFAGLQFYLLIMLYAVMRFFIETTRYIETDLIGPFTHNQIICIILFIGIGFLIVRTHKKCRQSKK
jgi:phosphatidylglycerol:prolipoprotein diacylglycerol transferase